MRPSKAYQAEPVARSGGSAASHEHRGTQVLRLRGCAGRVCAPLEVRLDEARRGRRRAPPGRCRSRSACARPSRVGTARACRCGSGSRTRRRASRPTAPRAPCGCSSRCRSASRAARICIALALFWICERSFWHDTTTPVGRCVMRTAESVTLTCWPPAPDDRYVSIRRSLGSISGSSVCFERGHAVERRERGLAPRVGVERRDADQPVHAALAREHPVRVATLDDEGRRRDARPPCPPGPRRARRRSPVARAQRVNMRSSICGPVLRVGAARAGVHLADRVALVVLAA